MRLKIWVFLINITILASIASVVIFNWKIPIQPIVINHRALPAPKVPALLQKIGFCESGNHQFNPDGTVKHGKIDPEDIGKYQINLHWQGARAKRMGFDLFTEAGNEGYAIWLFNSEGSGPWSWSKSCWNK